MIQKTILLIEDDDSTSDTVSKILKNDGYNVIISNDYVSSRNIINHLSPDLIITDNIEPQADGFGVLEFIRRNPRLSFVPVIQFTNGKKPDFPLESKPDALISKPVDPEKLLLLVSTCLSNKLKQAG